ncbi:MAG TPA: hypothetical protein VM029_10855 [Opitutaceae bacterium]|nr:hypothetical protein [Opitutaceae bacterium]
MPRPPSSIIFVAKTHWLVSAAIFISVAVLHFSTRKMPVAFETKTYVITLGMGTLYLLGGTLVWFGAPLGRLLSRVCALIYLVRPNLGTRLWQIMDSEEFRMHFARRVSDRTS